MQEKIPEKPSFCWDTRKRTLYILVVKAENGLEECPILHGEVEEMLYCLYDVTDRTAVWDK